MRAPGQPVPTSPLRSPARVPVLTVFGAADAKAIPLQPGPSPPVAGHPRMDPGRRCGARRRLVRPAPRLRQAGRDPPRRRFHPRPRSGLIPRRAPRREPGAMRGARDVRARVPLLCQLPPPHPLPPRQAPGWLPPSQLLRCPWIPSDRTKPGRVSALPLCLPASLPGFP